VVTGPHIHGIYTLTVVNLHKCVLSRLIYGCLLFKSSFFKKPSRISNLLKILYVGLQEIPMKFENTEIKIIKIELILSYLGSFLSSTYSIKAFLVFLRCKHCVYICVLPLKSFHALFQFLTVKYEFMRVLFSRIFCSFLNLTRVLTATKRKQENEDFIKLNFPQKISLKFL
jgi:hypothetical protein